MTVRNDGQKMMVRNDRTDRTAGQDGRMDGRTDGRSENDGQKWRPEMTIRNDRTDRTAGQDGRTDGRTVRK